MQIKVGDMSPTLAQRIPLLSYLQRGITDNPHEILDSLALRYGFMLVYVNEDYLRSLHIDTSE